MRRAATLVAAAALAVGLSAAPAAAAYDDPIVTVPVCDLDGHCGPSCSVYANPKRPVYCGYAY